MDFEAGGIGLCRALVVTFEEVVFEVVTAHAETVRSPDGKRRQEKDEDRLTEPGTDPWHFWFSYRPARRDPSPNLELEAGYSGAGGRLRARSD